jgi:hypothetical protein
MYVADLNFFHMSVLIIINLHPMSIFQSFSDCIDIRGRAEGLYDVTYPLTVRKGLFVFDVRVHAED